MIILLRRQQPGHQSIPTYVDLLPISKLEIFA